MIEGDEAWSTWDPAEEVRGRFLPAVEFLKSARNWYKPDRLAQATVPAKRLEFDRGRDGAPVSTQESFEVWLPGDLKEEKNRVESSRALLFVMRSHRGHG